MLYKLAAPKKLRIFGFIIFAIFHVSISCKNDLKRGKELSKLHCGGCHVYPEPNLLDKDSWLKVLPNMGYRMGIKTSELSLESNKGGQRVLESAVFPKIPTLGEEEWAKLQDFYLKMAPETLESTILPIATTKKFETLLPHKNWGTPKTTAIAFDSFTKKLWVSDGNTNHTYCLNEYLEITDSIYTGIVSDIKFYENTIEICDMGSFFPSDDPRGRFMVLDRNIEEKGLGIVDIKLSNLERPTSAFTSNINKEKGLETIITQFGNYLGSFGYFKSNGDYVELSKRAGALISYMEDLNHDGTTDLLVLFGQGDESIWAFYQNENGEFSGKKILEFPPTYGSLFFSYIDINSDGCKDIIYVNGDNADYKPILKPYHGIRIYLQNCMEASFSLESFIPLNGSQKIIAKDFDLDGDIDIAAIAFFPNPTNFYNENFIYLENMGNMTFKRNRLKDDIPGRWICMSSFDYDGDGDEDLALGAFNSFEIIDHKGLIDSLSSSTVPYTILRNKTIEIKKD